MVIVHAVEAAMTAVPTSNSTDAPIAALLATTALVVTRTQPVLPVKAPAVIVKYGRVSLILAPASIMAAVVNLNVAAVATPMTGYTRRSSVLPKGEVRAGVEATGTAPTAFLEMV